MELCSYHAGSSDNISALIALLPGSTVGPLKGGGVKGLRDQREATKQAEGRLQGSLDGDEHSG